MALPDTALAAFELPEEYASVPIHGVSDSPLSICAVVTRKPDPVAGHFVVLRSALDARILLGCLLDHGGRVHQWLEIWIQDIPGFLLGAAQGSRLEVLNNRILDERWKLLVQQFSSADRGTLYITGWEISNPPPTYLDLDSLCLVPIPATDSDPRVLCKDDSLLAAHGLPTYSMTVHRYLHQPSHADKALFIPVNPDSPRNGNTLELKSILSEKQLIPFNPSAGHLLVRRRSLFTLENVIDRLGGVEWTGIPHGRTKLKIGSLSMEDDQAILGAGWMFAGNHGRIGRFCETFHLKIRLLLELVDSVRTFVKRSQRPLFNLSPDSFEVEVINGYRGMPFLWTVGANLTDGGNAIEVKIPFGDTTYYLPAEPRMSTYRPQAAGQIISGRGTFQIQRFVPNPSGMTVIEGRFSTNEDISTISISDMICMAPWISGAKLSLYARCISQSGIQFGELQLRTMPQRFSDELSKKLQDAEGVELREVQFEILPLLSTPCDLYSLGVLATRLFLVNPQNRSGSTSLNVAKGEVAALARCFSSNPDSAEPAAAPPAKQAAAPVGEAPAPAGEADAIIRRRERLRNIFTNHPQQQRFRDALGPHRLVDEELTPDQAFAMLPDELWYDLLSVIIRMSPECTRDGFCKNYGDARPSALHRVFDSALAELESLLIRSRSLLLIDWTSNREIQLVIENIRHR